MVTSRRASFSGRSSSYSPAAAREKKIAQDGLADINGVESPFESVVSDPRGRWARALLASGFVGGICLVVIVLLYLTPEPEQLAGAQLKPLLLIMLALTLAAGAAGAVTDFF